MEYGDGHNGWRSVFLMCLAWFPLGVGRRDFRLLCHSLAWCLGAIQSFLFSFTSLCKVEKHISDSLFARQLPQTYLSHGVPRSAEGRLASQTGREQ